MSMPLDPLNPLNPFDLYARTQAAMRMPSPTAYAEGLTDAPSHGPGPMAGMMDAPSYSGAPGNPEGNPWPAPRLAPPGIGRYREMTIDELLLENRVIFLVGEINHASAMGVVMRMLYLSQAKKGQDINLYINSPGGSVDDTLAMIDTMNFLDCDVATYCIGKAMSGGALTLAAGTKGKRYCLPNAKVMTHQPFGGIYGQASDVKIQAEEILKTKQQLNEMIAGFTGQTVERVSEDSERDKFFSAQEAKDYGLVDEVVSRPPKMPDVAI